MMRRNTLFNRLLGAGLFGALLALAVAPTALAEPENRAKRSRRGGFNLLGAASTWNASVNRVQCGLDNQGNICTDVTGSPLGGGGFWPTGSPNQYIFNSGLQIAGIIDQNAPFEWAGDTVGAYIFDARGTQPQGQQVTLIYSSVNPSDVANWPNGAVVRDAAVFNDALLGRDAISQEDTWVRYWDGPGLLSGRLHPMGVLIEQRSLAWNFPSGNEDIMYFVFTFYNITASDPAAYSGLDPAIASEIAAIGADWVSQTEARTGVDIPSGGYRIDSLFGAFAMDPDVGDAGSNSSTAILPYSMGIAYKNDFDEPTWLWPAEINGPPFGPYPGFIGVKYLKSPIDPATGQQVGLTLFSNTTNPSAANSLFPDPTGVSQLWRYLSGRISQAEGDPPCQINPPIQRKLCALVQAPTDTRFYQSSGPFSVNPGESATIVVAYVHAAPIAQYVAPFFGGNLAPGIPPSGQALAAGSTTDTLRVLERAAGWVSHRDVDGNGTITQEEVQTVERSLLRKSLVAQNLFDNKFLLPFAPEGPDFFLVPGNNQVTVVWQKSVTENIGDPYFAIASNSASALFDPNYRFNDVEGYRIYRGRTRAQLELVAQFDYSGTTFVDFNGAWAYDGKCAPELGITEDCPSFPNAIDLVGDISQVPPGGRVELAGADLQSFTDFLIGTGDGTTNPPLNDLTPTIVPGTVTVTTAGGQSSTDDGVGGWTGPDVAAGSINYVTGAIDVTWTRATVDAEAITVTYQFTPIGAAGEVLVTQRVNPVEDAGFPALSNTGVPFAFVDQAVVNSTQYFYAVTAFDVNSVASGPGSLESPLSAQSVTPRAPARNTADPGIVTFQLVGRDDVVLDPTAVPTLDATTGTFSGPAAPTSAFTPLTSEVFADALQASTDFAYIRIDSVIPSYYHSSNWFISGTDAAGNVLTSFSFSVGTHLGEEDGITVLGPVETLLPANQQAAGQVGLGGIPYAGKASATLSVNAATFISRDAEFSAYTECWFYGGPENPPLNHNGGCTAVIGAGPGPIRDEGGSRWFEGDNETLADPTLGASWGQLTGVDSIYHPTPDFGFGGDPSTDLIRRAYQATSKIVRAADMKVYWGSTPGTVDSVIDVTHNVEINYSPQNRAAYGFVTDVVGINRTSIDPNPDGIITYFDYAQGPCFNNMPSWDTTGCESRTWAPAAVLGQVDVDGDESTAEGPGFAMVLAGELYFFQTATLPSAPAVWTLRTYAGLVSKDNDGAGNYVYFPKVSNPAVPGLRIKVSGGDPRVARAITEDDLSDVHTLPDPYYVTSGLEITPQQKVIKFVNLPTQAIIRIYSLSGVLVAVVEHEDVGLGGEATWNVRNRNNQFVASGVYFYHVETPSGAEKIGRFTVINSGNLAIGQQN